MALTYVLTPIKIGSVEIENRIFRSAHGTGFGDARGCTCVDEDREIKPQPATRE